MEALVVFYSRTGNNRYVAERLARDMGCDTEELLPRIGSYFGLLLSSFLKIGVGNRKLRYDIGGYQTIVLCGPLWMGQLAWPLYSFAKKHRAKVKNLHLVTCCGSDYEGRASKFGYDTVFQKYRTLLGDTPGKEFAIPVGLAVEGAKRKEANAMDVKLSDINFTGDILDEYKKVVKAIVGTVEAGKR